MRPVFFVSGKLARVRSGDDRRTVNAWADEDSVERFYTALNRLDAYLLLHRLQQVGVAAHVFNEHVSSIVGEVPPDVAQPQVWLEHARDRERAEAALAALAAEREQTGSVFCSACKEENPANFELCWCCGGNL